MIADDYYIVIVAIGGAVAFAEAHYVELQPAKHLDLISEFLLQLS